MDRIREIYRRSWFALPVLLALANIFARHYWTIYAPWQRPDTASYLHAWENIANMTLDCFRTPVYPVFAGAIRSLFRGDPTAATAIILLVQNCAYLLSVLALVYIARRGLKLPKWGCILAALPYCVFGIYPMYSSFVLTDGPGTFLLILLVPLVMLMVERPSAKNILAANACVLMLVFLRPSFIYVPVAIAITACLLRCGRSTKGATALAASLLASAIVIPAYGMIFKERADYTGISSVSDLNRTLMNLKYVTDADSTAYPFHHAMLQLSKDTGNESVSKWDLYFEIASDNAKALHLEVERFYADHPELYTRALTDTIRDNLRQSFLGGRIPVYILLLIPACYLIFLLAAYRLRGQWLRLMLWLLVAGNLGVVLLGAPNEYPRLMMPVFPLQFLMMADIAVTTFNSIKRAGT